MAYALLKSSGRDWFVLGEDGRRRPETCIEGTAAEWVAIAAGIRKGQSTYFTRCAVAVHDNGCEFYSPRNSYGDAEYLSLDEADALAGAILNEHGPITHGDGI